MRRPGDLWPLIGRQAELRTIVDSLGMPAAAGWVLAGSAGVGKTRLAREALSQAERQGWATVWVVGSRSAASIPLGAFAHLLPDKAPAAPSRLELLGQARRALVERGANRRLLVGVDDAHVLDDASATLVYQLAETGSFVLATVRTGEPTPDPVVALWKEGLAGRLELEALSEAEVYELARGVLGGEVDGLTLRSLWEASRGNVLFLRELVVGGLEAGLLVQDGGVWSWKGPIVMSRPLSEVIEARMSGLADDERSLLEVLAHGEPMGVWELESRFAPEMLEATERRGLMALERDGKRMRVRPAHPLYGEALRSNTAGLRRRGIYRSLVGCLEQTGARRREDHLRLATWYLETGDKAPSKLLVAGARRALAGFDPALAERLAREAAENHRDAASCFVLGEALLQQGRTAEAAAVLRGADRLAGSDEEFAAIADRQANALYRLGRYPEALKVLSAAEGRIADRSIRNQLKAMEATILVHMGQVPEGLMLARKVLESSSVGTRERLVAASTVALAAAARGRPDEAVTIRQEWIEPARRMVDVLPYATAFLLSSEALALNLAGRLRDAEETAQSCYQEGIRLGSQDVCALGAMIMGSVELCRGAISSALRWHREGVALYRSPSGIKYLPLALALLAQTAALGGDLATAHRTIEQAETEFTPGLAFFSPFLALARAWVSAAGASMRVAQEQALGAADDAEAMEQFGVAVVALHDLARLGRSDVAAPRLSALVSSFDGPFAPACAAHAQALVAHDGPGLDRASELFKAMGAMLLAAEAAAEAAATYRSEGRKGSMLASSARARRLLESCEGARTPALSRLAPDPLTPREREVGMLAAGGLTSPEIAERLVLSVRTVEGYLQLAYVKLGIASRAELRSVLAIP